MSSAIRDTRLNEASSLQEAMQALEPLDPLKRQGFVHDKLMSAIDDICEKHKGRQGGQAFNAAQMLVLRDIVHHIVYILDPLNKKERGFLRTLIAEWKDSKPFDKIKTLVAAAVFVYGLLVGAYGLAVAGWHLMHPTMDIEPPASVRPAPPR